MTEGLRLPVLGLAAILAACHPTANEVALPSEPSFQAEQVQLLHEIHMVEGQTRLDGRQEAALSHFVGAVAPRPGEAVVVTASGPAARERGDLVAEALARRGVRAVVLPAHGTASAPITVALSRVVSLPTGCLSGDDYLQIPDPARPPIGCVNDFNLMKMVERPGDLFQGRVPGPAEAGPAAAGVVRYRTGTQYPLIVQEVR